MVHTHRKHRGISRRGDDDPFGSTLQVGPYFLHGNEETSGLHYMPGTSITPFDVGGILFLEDGVGLHIDDKIPILSLDCAVKLGVSGIIPEHRDYVNEGAIASNSILFAKS